MLSQFCIRRPIFATVLSLFIVLSGLIALRVLPLSQYPQHHSALSTRLGYL